MLDCARKTANISLNWVFSAHNNIDLKACLGNHAGFFIFGDLKMATKTDGQFPLVNGGIFSVYFQANEVTSDVFECDNFQAGALILPSNFEGASLTFLASFTGQDGTFVPLLDPAGAAGSLLTLPVATGWLPLDPVIFAYIPYFQIVSNVAQSVLREVKVMLGPVWK